MYDLLDRVLPGSKPAFVLTLLSAGAACTGGVAAPCFSLADAPGGRIAVSASSASELSAGIGHYFRDFCNFTIGWPRGGGSRLVLPSAGGWPAIGAAPVTRRRAVPYSHAGQVCTHSYSLAWYDWTAWQNYIDWMALSGINLFYAMTGQELIQWKVFTSLGVADADVRSWFNGPAFLTWSRGQNEYGNNIAGPLPLSWMQAQHALQVQILGRARSLGISTQLPGFQGNVPIALKAILSDANITQQGDTGWMYSVDPAFGRIADLWMKQLLADFGRDGGAVQVRFFCAPRRTSGRAACSFPPPIRPPPQSHLTLPPALPNGRLLQRRHGALGRHARARDAPAPRRRAHAHGGGARRLARAARGRGAGRNACARRAAGAAAAV